MTEAQMAQTVGACQSRLKTKLEAVGFDPTLIITLITTLLPVVLELLGNCNKEGVRQRLKHPVLARVLLARSLRNTKNPLLVRDAAELAKACCDAADDTDDVGLEGVCECARQMESMV